MSSVRFFKGQQVIRTSGNFGATREGHVYKVREDCHCTGSLFLEHPLTGDALTGSYDPDMFSLHQPLTIGQVVGQHIPPMALQAEENLMPEPEYYTIQVPPSLKVGTIDEAVRNCKEIKAKIKELDAKYRENLHVMTSYGIKFIEE